MFPRTLVACLSACALLAQPAPGPSLQDAAEAYQHGKLTDAERILNELLKRQPPDAAALVLMGVVFDSENRYQDAEPYYRQALQITPSSAQVLNNAANHYLAMGQRDRARELYLKTVAAEPNHPNANLQLAQMCIDDKQGRQAIAYLDRAGVPGDPAVRLLRARALALAGQCRESEEVLEKGTVSGSDAAAQYAAGMAQAECRSFEAAEQSFSIALDADPRNFDIIYNLGLAALRAGHLDRAQSVLEVALREKPEDTDSLYAMAQVFEARNQLIPAAAALAKAEKISPDRVDVILLLARISARLEFFEDSATAYDRYLKLKPEDDAARRERGFQLARANQPKEARRDLEWYTARHPGDALGYFELAVACVSDNRETALALLDKAIGLAPELYQARFTRAVIRIENDQAAAAIPDLEFFLEKEPRNVEALSRLGQAYLASNRAHDAAQILERALAVSPDSRPVLVQYHRALIMLKRHSDAAAVLGRLKKAANADDDPRRRVGLVDYLSLSPEDQRARRLSNLQQNSDANPTNYRLRITFARELFAQGRKDEGLRIMRELAAADLSPALRAQCGRVLLDVEQFADARAFLERALADAPDLSEARLDLAIALFRLQDPVGALRELDGDPKLAGQGDYCLVRAQILDAQGKVKEAAAALNQGIHAAPTRAALYYQATSFLLKHKLYGEAQTLLEGASRILPDDGALVLAQVVTLDLLQKDVESQRLVAQIQARWPEWERPYVVKGILLESKGQSAAARQALETAIALGAATPETYYYQALAIMHSAPEELDAAQNAIERALASTSDDPYIYLLSGRISMERQEYTKAVERLLCATRLEPRLLAAHNALREAYTILGDQKKSRDEVEVIKGLTADGADHEATSTAIEDVLFRVRPPQSR